MVYTGTIYHNCSWFIFNALLSVLYQYNIVFAHFDGKVYMFTLAILSIVNRESRSTYLA